MPERSNLVSLTERTPSTPPPIGEKLRITLISPRGPLYRSRGGIWKKTMRYAPLTLTTLASLVPPEIPADVSIIDEGIDEINLDRIQADLVGISAITGTAPRSYELSAELRKRGIPVVLEIGPRDLASNNIVLKRRDTGSKEVLPQAEAVARMPQILAEMQSDLYSKAKQRMNENTVIADSLEKVEDFLRDVTAENGGGKFVMAHLKDDPSCDARLKQFKATVRCIPMKDEFDGAGTCIITGERVDRRVVIAKAY